MSWGIKQGWDINELIKNANQEGFEIIPDNTYAAAVIYNIEEKSEMGPPIFRVTWRIKGGQYNNRFVHQNIKISDPNEDIHKKAMGMFARICQLCQIEFPETKPNRQFFMYLFGKPCGIKIMEYHLEEQNKHGNWVCAIYSMEELQKHIDNSSKNQSLTSKTHQQLDAMQALATNNAEQANNPFDDDLPF